MMIRSAFFVNRSRSSGATREFDTVLSARVGESVRFGSVSLSDPLSETDTIPRVSRRIAIPKKILRFFIIPPFNYGVGVGVGIGETTFSWSAWSLYFWNVLVCTFL